MPGENLSRDEAQERAALLSVEGYEVFLDLRSAVGESDGDAGAPRTFRSVTTLRFRCAEPGAASFADLIAPSVTAVSLNGKDLDPSEVFDGSRIALEDLREENELVVDAQCAYSRTGEGMHRFVDPEDGEVYLYTQYEPADSRRVFANFEQPDLKAPFRFSAQAPEGWTVWSNGVGELTDGVWQFAETKPISTYITAVVAGPYHYVTDSYERVFEDGTRLEIPLGAMCRKGLAKHFDADDVFLVTKQGLDFFHDHFDYPYPFGKYDQAFVPEYNLGAMENPGCVTFREEFIFRGKVTQASYERRANVILHEMAHMWFGDLVTMRWWDDLWLNESFATYMATHALSQATRFSDAWVRFAAGTKAGAMAQDQMPTTHPISADIVDTDAVRLHFDGITYLKGASTLKQLVAWVGQDAFRAGLQKYFRKYAWRNAELADFLSNLEQASGRKLTDWSTEWLETAGVNTLRADFAGGDAYESFSISQTGTLRSGLASTRACSGSSTPLGRESTIGTIEPTFPAFTGFVFKIQANMDPNHRDRIAFVRLCSGKFRRGMRLFNVREKKAMNVAAPIFFFAQQRETIDEAFPGDIIGIPNHGTLHVGDSLTEGEALQFVGIPNFAPEILRRVVLEDALRADHLGAGP